MSKRLSPSKARFKRRHAISAYRVATFADMKLPYISVESMRGLFNPSAESFAAARRAETFTMREVVDRFIRPAAQAAAERMWDQS